MSEQDLTLLLSFIGALAWLPFVLDKFKQQNIKGKIISRYFNQNNTQSYFVYKLSLFFSKDIEVKSISCIITDTAENIFKSTAWNPSYVIFKFGDQDKRLSIENNSLLNNCVHFDNNKAYSGYLIFTFPNAMAIRAKSTKFVFESYDGNKYDLEILESDLTSALFHDDSIWK